MRRLLSQIDFHILVLGLIISLLFIGVISTVTFIPGTPQISSVIGYSCLPILVLLMPMVIIGTIDRKKKSDEAVGHFIINTLLVLSFGIASGLIIYNLQPKIISKSKQTESTLGFNSREHSSDG